MITGNLFDFVWGSVELALNILLYSRLKLPQKVMSHGLLRMSLVRECNYNFGVDTKIVRYVVASLLTPNMVSHFRKSNNSYHFIYGCFMCFDAMIVADILPMTDTIYAMILILRLFHLLEIIPKVYKATLSIKIHVKKAVKVQFNLLNQLNTTNSNIIISKKLEVSPPNSSQTTNASSLNEFESTQKSKRRPQFPNVYQIKVQTSKTTKINILIDEPDKFDLLFDQQLNMDRRMNLQIKLNLCAQVYQNLKKHYPCEWLLRQIAQYQAELLLLDQ
ncbi:unnamed protein product (macronuclear) [Paramecium tetraurelia]|uniref:Uncharacterized protein n=1 Tax=Paramecium tetraurelia TaxID=5888 RepID=A0E9W0_PARTE|nr:uncharacterized protein GSPATT00024808001 [Paramecium tetraurelia]CAK92077.1 unnamed protein product [Paramecium tetraurelia]|eukprot:XP_001459474.1 hypothetical protein (macronuclear) [Paramecium tetraurelia strain d4-2]